MWSRVALYKYFRYSLQCRRTAYFGWAKPCSCSHCCSRHLWFYDSGRLGRVEIVTLRVGAKAKEGKGGLAPFPPLFGFNMALSRGKTFARPKKTPALQATWDIKYLLLEAASTTCLRVDFRCRVIFNYVRTCVKFTFAKKIEAMYEGLHLSVKVETRSTSRLAQHLISCLYFYLFTWFKFTCVKYVRNMDVFIRARLY